MSDNPLTEFLVKPSVGSAIARLRTYLNIVLDESSSMGSVRVATIDAYNAFIKGQRGDRVDDLFVTLTKFADATRMVYKVKPVQQVPALGDRTYMPEGSTALYDGVYKTLVAMEKEVGPDARVLTVVITDGEDNMSREVRNAAHLKRIVQEYERRGNWTFVFLAAGWDAYTAGAAMGFQTGNVQAYTVNNVEQALATVGRGVTNYRHSDNMQTSEFYTAQKFRRTQWVQDPE